MLINHFVELVAPVLLIIPWRRGRIVGGVIQILFQAILISSGNLSFLNWLTMLPALFCFDDASLSWLFSRKICNEVIECERNPMVRSVIRRCLRHFCSAALGAMLIFLRYTPIHITLHSLGTRCAFSISSSNSLILILT